MTPAATLEAYRRLREDRRIGGLLPNLEPCRVVRSAPTHYGSADEIRALLAGCGPILGWITSQSAPPSLVRGAWFPPTGGGAVLQADLALDPGRSLQLRHAGARLWLATRIEEYPVDAVDVPEATFCLAQELTFELQGASGAKLRYRRFWSFDASGRAVAGRSRIVDVIENEPRA